MKINLKEKDNGKSMIHATKTGTGTINPRGSRCFKYMKQNMFIGEYSSLDILIRIQNGNSLYLLDLMEEMAI